MTFDVSVDLELRNANLQGMSSVSSVVGIMKVVASFGKISSRPRTTSTELQEFKWGMGSPCDNLVHRIDNELITSGN